MDTDKAFKQLTASKAGGVKPSTRRYRTRVSDSHGWLAIYGEATVTVYGIAIYYVAIDTHELRAYREEFDRTHMVLMSTVVTVIATLAIYSYLQSSGANIS